MAKFPPDAQSDPMARDVDRLLAQLSRQGPQVDDGREAPPSRISRRAAGSRPTSTAAALRTRESGRHETLGLWSRVALGGTLGLGLTQWPYPRECGWALLGYLAPVAMVMLSGAWIGFASWKIRNAVVHLVALVLVYWGIVLAAEQILPRIGYAAETASWRCQ
jgi:hypothetical protein